MSISPSARSCATFCSSKRMPTTQPAAPRALWALASCPRRRVGVTRSESENGALRRASLRPRARHADGSLIPCSLFLSFAARSTAVLDYVSAWLSGAHGEAEDVATAREQLDVALRLLQSLLERYAGRARLSPRASCTASVRAQRARGAAGPAGGSLRQVRDPRMDASWRAHPATPRTRSRYESTHAMSAARTQCFPMIAFLFEVRGGGRPSKTHRAGPV
jgi:hypothetical protein